MADERVTYTIEVDFTKGFSTSDANLVENYTKFKAKVKSRLTENLPCDAGKMKARLVSV